MISDIITYKQEGTYRQRLALLRHVDDGWTVSIIFPKNKQVTKRFATREECIEFSDEILLKDYPVKVEEYI